MKSISTVSLCTSPLPPQIGNPKTTVSSSSSRPHFHFLLTNSPSRVLFLPFLRHRRTVPLAVSDRRGENPPPASSFPTVAVSTASVVAAAALILLSFSGIPACPAAVARPLPAVSVQNDSVHTDATSENVERVDADVELEAAFNAWKSKTFALSVPLRVVALRGSVPPSWIKDFVQSQSKRLKFNTKFVTSLEDIFSDLSLPMNKHKVAPASTVAADIVSVGDSWLSYAIKSSMIEPMRGVEDQDWYKGLNEKWKVRM